MTNRCVKTLGSHDNIRFLNISLYQGAPGRKDILTLEMAASDNALVTASLSTDPTIIATGAGKKRFYLFTNYDGDLYGFLPLLSLLLSLFLIIVVS